MVAIIDDELDVTTFLQLALEDQGFEVQTISDSAIALGQLTRRPPDLICLDLLMPRYTGLSLYREIVRDPDLRHCPVVIVSGLTGSDGLAGMLRQAGDLPPPAAFLEKPLDLTQLIRVVTGLLEQPVATAGLAEVSA